MQNFGHHEIHLRDYLYILRKRRHVAMLFAIIVISLGALFTISEKVIYRAGTTLLIERDNPNVVDFKEVMSFDSSSTDYYQTQYQMLKSRSMIKKLVKNESLEKDKYLHALQSGRMRALLRTYFSWLGPFGLKDFMTQPALEDLFIKKMLRIEPVRNSRLVEVAVLHPDPERAADLANAVADLFINRTLEERFSISKRATSLIGDQLTELKDRVAEAEKKLQDYKEKQGLVSIPTLSEENEFLQGARLELVKIQAEESKLAKRYLPAHPKRIHIRSQIEGLEEKIKEEEARILTVGRAAIDYSELEREASSSRQIYEALLRRMQETTSEAQTQASNISVVDRAEPPAKPFKPRPLLNMMAAIFMGVMGGFLLAFFAEYLDSTVKIPEDIETALGLDLFGIIPVAEKLNKTPMKGVVLFDATQPSPSAEAFRALRTALLFRLRQTAGCRVILSTSANPEEGKTTVSLNLATAFAQNHLKVLIIDADLRKPSLYKLFNVPAPKGLADILEGEASPEECIRTNAGQTGVDLLTSGTYSKHPAEILGSEKMKSLLEMLKSSYDVILLDSPPFLAVADVIVLNEYADAIVVVARYQKTDKRHLKDIKRRFGLTPDKTLGVVINRVSVREKDHYYHQYYYYGYGDDFKKQ